MTDEAAAGRAEAQVQGFPWGRVLAAMVLAIILRTAYLGMAPWPSHDGAEHLMLARDWPAGQQWQWSYKHPLYPILLTLGGSGGTALDYYPVAVIINMLAEVTNVGLLAWLAWVLVGFQAAWVAAMLYACAHMPVQLTAEAMTEPVYLTMLLLTLRLLLLCPGSRIHCYLIGLLVGLLAVSGYLVRPEGLLLLVLACAWWTWLAWRDSHHLWQLAGVIDMVLVLALLAWLAGPAAWKWALTPKADIIAPQAFYQAGLGDWRDLPGVLAAIRADPALLARKVLHDTPRVLNATILAAFYPLAALALWGLLIRRKQLLHGQAVVLAWWAVLHLGTLALVIVETRLAVAVLPCLIIWATAGLQDLMDRVGNHVPGKMDWLVVAVIVMGILKTLRSPGPEAGRQQQFARDLLASGQSIYVRPAMVTHMPRLAAFLNGNWIPMRQLRYAPVPAGATLMVVQPEKIVGWERADWEQALPAWKQVTDRPAGPELRDLQIFQPVGR